MPQQCLAELLENLDGLGELTRVEVRVSADQEIAEVTGRIAEAGGPALLFGDVEGFSQPILTNLLATQRRICHALGAPSLY